jgi:23S rRNA (cytidine1920-2'-O)/16S rRNA (cytidine1409-2'-O)-methyltransferase
MRSSAAFEADRLDRVLVARGLAPSVERAAALILAGEVLVNDAPADKAGSKVPKGAVLRLRSAPSRYVGRGGLKLEAALDGFPFDPAGLVAADLGASTGGFTDCLLQRGAARVYAVDVGTHQLDYKLRVDPRVVVMEQTNVRHLRGLPEPIDLIVGDLSFISLRLVVEPIAAVTEAGWALLGRHDSPIPGARAGNIEILLHLRLPGGPP